MRRTLPLFLTLLLALPAAAQDKLTLTLTAGKKDLRDCPVTVPVQISPKHAGKVNVVLTNDDLELAGQLTAPGLLADVPDTSSTHLTRELHFILPALKAGASTTLTVDLTKAPEGDAFGVVQGKDRTYLFQASRANDAKRPALTYMRPKFDDSSKDRRNETYKVFHHVHDPVDGKILTNGGYLEPPKGTKKLLFPHHRGLMFAFNRISYAGGKKKADTWHATTGDAHQEDAGQVQQSGGKVLARHQVKVDWYANKETFAKENRELTVYDLKGGWLIEFASRLKSNVGPIKLDGDPQHAGFQFRASNLVAENSAKQTYYIRPDGKDKPGSYRNWPGNKNHVDLPWHVMSFVLDGQRYSVCYLNHPTNPRESRFSERDYGRFGCYFAYDLTADRPLKVNYRVWVQRGEMTPEQAQALHDAFAHPPTVAVK